MPRSGFSGGLVYSEEVTAATWVGLAKKAEGDLVFLSWQRERRVARHRPMVLRTMVKRGFIRTTFRRDNRGLPSRCRVLPVEGEGSFALNRVEKEKEAAQQVHAPRKGGFTAG